jgi:pilus assembly protein CpaD
LIRSNQTSTDVAAMTFLEWKNAHRILRAAAVGLICATSAGLAGCNLDREPEALATVSPDPTEAHPIVVGQAPELIDIYPVGGHVDEASAGRIRAFVDEYHRIGGGRMIVAAPAGAPYASAMADVRRNLAAAGLKGVVAMGTYPPPGPGVQPIKLTFRGLAAKVTTPCGRWPTDLASGSSLDGWKNGPYENFGCAYQTAIAAQVADPRDLEQPRAFDPSDAQMRMRAITDVRNGSDPGTTWMTKLTTIGAVGN